MWQVQKRSCSEPAWGWSAQTPMGEGDQGDEAEGWAEGEGGKPSSTRSGWVRIRF